MILNSKENSIKSGKFKKYLLITGILLSILLLIDNYYIEDFINNVLSSYNGVNLTNKFIIILAISLVVSLLVYYKNKSIEILKRQYCLDYQYKYIDRMLSKNIKFFENKESEIISIITDDLVLISDWESYLKILCKVEYFNIVIMSVYLAYKNIFIFICVISFILAASYIGVKINSDLALAIDDRQQSNSIIAKMFIDGINNSNNINQLGKVGYFEQKFENYVYNEHKRIINNITKYHSGYITQIVFANEIIPLLSLCLAFAMSVKGFMSNGAIIIVFNIVVIIMGSVQNLAEISPIKKSTKLFKERINHIFDNKEYEENRRNEKIDNFNELDININSYKYSDDNIILEDIKFKIDKNDFIIIKGESGKGKTSLINLISRFIDMDNLDGSIKYNGRNINDFKISEYYQKVLQCEQTVILFNSSLEENIKLGDYYTDELLEDVIHTSCLDGFVQKQGLEYIIDEKSGNISGSEKQRIGLARILIRRPELLILDEVTSSLNSDIKETIAKRIKEFTEKYNITTIVVTHGDEFDTYANEIIIL